MNIPTNSTDPCKRCGSLTVSHIGDDWRCRNCGAQTPGWTIQTSGVARSAGDPPIDTTASDHDPRFSAQITPAERDDILRADPPADHFFTKTSTGTLLVRMSGRVKRFVSIDAYHRTLRMHPPDEPTIHADDDQAVTLVVSEPAPDPEPQPEPAADGARRTASDYTHDELIGYLQTAAATRGRAPGRTWWDVNAGANRPDGAPSAYVYAARFGSWVSALAAAGLDPNPPGPGHRTTSAAGGSGTPAAPPTSPPAPPQAPVPDEDSPEETTPGDGVVVEAPQATPFPAPIVTSSSNRAVLTWNDPWEDLRIRYARTLVGTIEEAEIHDESDAAWFDRIADRTERILGLANGSAA